jgi:hypothetical protein
VRTGGRPVPLRRLLPAFMDHSISATLLSQLCSMIADAPGPRQMTTLIRDLNMCWVCTVHPVMYRHVNEHLQLLTTDMANRCRRRQDRHRLAQRGRSSRTRCGHLEGVRTADKTACYYACMPGCTLRTNSPDAPFSAT